ncbi:MAG: Na(+)/H(+) antiporter subunit [Pseudomonadota bacterium]|jgi:multicomponent Na+:H+ antiporter subunit C
MEPILTLGFGAMVAAGVYMALSRHLVRMILGIALVATAVNVLIFTAGRVATVVPPVIPKGAVTLAEYAANPLPQALVLTAIVIGFALTAFSMVLALRAHQALRTLDTDAMRLAEAGEIPAAAGRTEAARG